jgi:D-3-phosphoglycerate dehydrogenase
MLAQITEIFAKNNINIHQQINQSRGEVAYNVLDIDPVKDGSVLNLKQLQREVTTLPGVLSSRVLLGTPGIGYARNIDGKYYV